MLLDAYVPSYEEPFRRLQPKIKDSQLAWLDLVTHEFKVMATHTSRRLKLFMLKRVSTVCGNILKQHMSSARRTGEPGLLNG